MPHVEPSRNAALNTPAATDLDVALVHDYLNQRGGAERVALAMSDIWPRAPIYTSLYREASTFPEFRERTVRTTALNAIPVDQSFRVLLPLYAPAFALMPPIKAQVVVASSSGWAHHARSVPGSLHVVYCHTPARWLIGKQRSSSALRHAVSRPLLPVLRHMDRAAAHRADLYLANSRNVQRKISDFYGISAELLHPPVDIDRFTPTPGGKRLLTISRLLPYKRVDLAIRAASDVGLGLDIVGDGPSLDDLKRIAGPSVKFHGAASDAELTGLVENCRAVCVTAEDDFGIVPVEAQAAGKPVVAYGAGGALETVVDGVTGILFPRQDVASVSGAIRALDSLPSDAFEIAQYATRFSATSFRESLLEIISRHHQAIRPQPST